MSIQNVRRYFALRKAGYTPAKAWRYASKPRLARTLLSLIHKINNIELLSGPKITPELLIKRHKLAVTLNMPKSEKR